MLPSSDQVVLQESLQPGRAKEEAHEDFFPPQLNYSAPMFIRTAHVLMRMFDLSRGNNV